MRAPVHGDIRLLPGAGRRRVRARTAADLLTPAFIIVLLVAVLVAVLSGMPSERRAVRALPAGERLALLSRTVDELRQFCAEGRPDALKDHCRELATFASHFDECQGECEALVRRELTPVPTR